MGAPAQSNGVIIEGNGTALEPNARVGVLLVARSTQVDGLVLESPGLIDEHGHAAAGDVGHDAAASGELDVGAPEQVQGASPIVQRPHAQ